MTDHKAVIAYTDREMREHFRQLDGDGVYRPALARYEKWLAEHDAVVEAQALEALADKYAWASSVRAADIRARAVEIREGRQ